MRMRVYEQEQEQDQQAPFRVLSPGGRILYDPQPVLRSPPPARAPEPYKLAPPGTGCARSQRKSSFAIIAEPETFAPPSSRPSSGRLSPFRGRGFKGPPPRSTLPNGRAHSPPEVSTLRPARPRPGRPGSVSQNNSPKRSLIPRAETNRSGSSSKGPSPRFGRRANNRYTSSIGTSETNNRRPAHREIKRRSDLQPISSASKVKPPTNNNNNNSKSNMNNNISNKLELPKSLGSKRVTKSEERLNGKLSSSRHGLEGKRFITAKASTPRHKSSSTEALDSPSKIPLVRGSVTNNLSSPTKSPKKPSATTVRNAINKPPPSASNSSNNNNSSSNNQAQTQSKKTTEQLPPDASADVSQMVSGGKVGSQPKEAMHSTVEEDLGLIDLLKQTSGATGTSSVVNTTTTTAVQPLQIDASSILAESELVAKLANLEKKQKNLEADDQSPDLQKSSSNQSKKAQDTETKTNSNQNQQPITANDTQNQTTTKTDLAESKPSAANESNGNSRNNNLTQTMIKHFGPNSSNEEKSSSGNPNNNNNIESDQIKATDDTTTTNTNTAIISIEPEVERVKEQLSKRPMEDQDKQRQTLAIPPSNQAKAESKANVAKNIGKPMATESESKMANDSTTEMKNADDKANNHMTNATRINIEVPSKSQAEVAVPSSESPGSVRSTDTGVSVNTVRGVSSAKEKTGLHLIKTSDEIETLSGNVGHIDKNGDNQLPSGEVGEVKGAAAAAGASGAATTTTTTTTRWQRLKERYRTALGCGKDDRNCLGRCCSSCWPKMRCLACKRDPKARLWPTKQAKGVSAMQLDTDQPRDNKPLGRWEKLKDACRCRKVRDGRCCNWRQRRWQHRQQHRQVAPADAERSNCCPAKGRLSSVCQSMFSLCKCHSRKSKRTKTVKAKHSLTSVAAPPLSEETRPKIPDVLVEHNSLMRGAIPCLPVPVAWFCLLWNVMLPGSGTIFSGFFNICMGQPRFSAVASLRARFGALIVNFLVGVSQLFTVLFCLVGWGWSIWWGVTMIRLARKYKRFKDSEALANDPEARGGPETATLPAPGVPAQPLRRAK